MNIRIYIANLGAYNRGQLIGKWLELPMDSDELADEIKGILKAGDDQAMRDGEYCGPDEEIAIHDWEAPFEIGEYSNPYDLNEMAEEMIDIDEPYYIVEAVMEHCSTTEEAIEVLTNREYSVVWNCSTEEELAINIDEELLPFDYQEAVRLGVDSYLDWSKIGRDLYHNGYRFHRAESGGEYHRFAMNVHDR